MERVDAAVRWKLRRGKKGASAGLLEADRAQINRRYSVIRVT